jgi:D-arabinose 1-dehydrogenase-like Zn-dependent alcohol dehydrogenase
VRPSPPPPGTGNLDCVREVGADTVIDYRTQDLEAVVHDYDVVLDSQSGDTLAKSLRVLKPGGIAIGMAGPPDPDSPANWTDASCCCRSCSCSASMTGAPEIGPTRVRASSPGDWVRGAV